MCGIGGAWEKNGDKRDLRNRIQKALRLQSFRGPDAEGMWEDPEHGLVLGHRRLAVIDLSTTAGQPMVSECGRYVLLFNGEIYNFGVLAADPDLCAWGPLRSRSDTEVLLRALATWGIEAFSRLDGMFALAFYDAKEKTLLLGRDPFGEKPLFLAQGGRGNWYFSSTLASLLVLVPFEADVDDQAISLFWHQSAIASPKTAYRNVESIVPGTWVRLAPSGREDGVYWAPTYRTPEPIGFHEAAKRAKTALVESLRRRLISDVPLGCFLSGGVDSSLTTALVARELGTKLKTFSVGFKDVPSADVYYANLVAKQYDTEHKPILLDSTSLEDLPRILWHYGQPYADFSCIPTYHLSAAARREVTVVVTGDGGDEMFGGYVTTIGAHLAEQLRATVPGSLLTLLRNCTSPLIQMKGGGWLRRIGMLAAMADCEPSQAYRLLWQPRGYSDITRVNSQASSWVERYFDEHPEWPAFQRSLYCDLRGRMADVFCVKVDVASMAHSLETRTPYLARQVFDAVRSLGPDIMLKRHVRKSLLKKVAESYLPRDLIYRAKQGFTPPIGDWLTQRQYRRIVTWAVSDESPAVEWLKMKSVRKIWLEHHGGGRDHQSFLFSVLAFSLWWRLLILRDLDPAVPLSQIE